MIIDKHTLIQPVTRLTKHLNVANFTTGMPNGFNTFAPLVTSHLIDTDDPRMGILREYGIKALLQHHKIARNLQDVGEKIVEPLLDKFGNDVMVYASYMNPLRVSNIVDKASKHFTGEAINVFLRSGQDNMFLEAEKILDSVKGQVSHAILNFNHGSWLHLVTNGPFGFLKGDMKNPIIATIDHQLGQMMRGFFPFRGMVKNPWATGDFAPFRRLAALPGKKIPTGK